LARSRPSWSGAPSSPTGPSRSPGPVLGTMSTPGTPAAAAAAGTAKVPNNRTLPAPVTCTRTSLLLLAPVTASVVAEDRSALPLPSPLHAVAAVAAARASTRARDRALVRTGPTYPIPHRQQDYRW